MGEHGQNDGIRVAGGEEYEIEHFAQKHGITEQEARQLIEEHGNMRDVLDREAEKLKQNGGTRG